MCVCLFVGLVRSLCSLYGFDVVVNDNAPVIDKKSKVNAAHRRNVEATARPIDVDSYVIIRTGSFARPARFAHFQNFNFFLHYLFHV